MITMRRPQFSLKTMLVLMLAVACFCGGIEFERERIRRGNGIFLDVDGNELVVGSGVELLVVGPGQLSVNHRSLFTFATMLWIMAVAGAFLAGRPRKRRLNPSCATQSFLTA